MASASETKKLYRSRDNRVVAGVCGGLADYFSNDVTLVRVLWVIVLFATGLFPGIALYLIAWFIIPEEPLAGSKESDYSEPLGERFKKVAHEMENEAEKIGKHFSSKTSTSHESNHRQRDGGRTAGSILVFIGVMFFIREVTGINVWSSFWPILLIIIGFGIIVRRS